MISLALQVILACSFVSRIASMKNVCELTLKKFIRANGGIAAEEEARAQVRNTEKLEERLQFEGNKPP